MLSMFLVLPALQARPDRNGHDVRLSGPASRFSFLALVLALFMFGYVARVANQPAARARPRPRRPARCSADPAPVLAAGSGPADGSTSSGCAAAGGHPPRTSLPHPLHHPAESP